MRGVGEICGMGRFRPRRTPKAQFESTVQSSPQDVGPEGNASLFNEQVPEPALAQVRDVCGSTEGEGLIDVTRNPIDNPKDSLIRRVPWHFGPGKVREECHRLADDEIVARARVIGGRQTGDARLQWNNWPGGIFFEQRPPKRCLWLVENVGYPLTRSAELMRRARVNEGTCGVAHPFVTRALAELHRPTEADGDLNSVVSMEFDGVHS